MTLVKSLRDLRTYMTVKYSVLLSRIYLMYLSLILCVVNPCLRFLVAVPEVCSPGAGAAGAADRRHDRGGADTRLSGRRTARRSGHQVRYDTKNSYLKNVS
jgi:hypothetical protein